MIRALLFTAVFYNIFGRNEFWERYWPEQQTFEIVTNQESFIGTISTVLRQVLAK